MPTTRPAANARLVIIAVRWMTPQGSALARSAAEVCSLEQYVRALPAPAADRCLRGKCSKPRKGELGFEYVLMDSALIRAHQPAQRTAAQAIGCSRGGLSSKIHPAIDALGNPPRIPLTAERADDITGACALIQGMRPGHVIADAALPRHHYCRRRAGP